MPPRIRGFRALAVLIAFASPAAALEKPDTTYQVYQFPRDQIPRIDGDAADWAAVPKSYVITRAEMRNTSSGTPAAGDATLAIRVKVAWVSGLNRLYFLYEATDDYWDFADPGLRNDTFEIMVDGDASGGPLAGRASQGVWTEAKVGTAAARADARISDTDSHWAVAGVHAQNYHIMTPARQKDWAMAWGAPTWTKEFPWANSAQRYAFAPGEGGSYTLEFYITPFDYAGPEGPERAVPSELVENKIIGLSWIVIDYDGPTPRGFWTLSPERTSFGHASELCAFRLMPIEPDQQPELAARWSFKIVDHARRVVAFRDDSIGDITAWRWDFGDGTTSADQYPTHTYAEAGNHVVTLEVTGPAGTDKFSRIWDIQFRP